MKITIPCIIGLLLMVSSSFAHEGLKHLMPMPQKIVVHAGSFQLDSSFQIRIDGPVSGRINSYATQFLNRLRNRTGLFMQQPVVNDSERGPNNATCVFSYTATPGFPLQLGEDESYVLTVQSGLIKLTAKNDLGILRGMETLYQLLSINASGYYFPNVTITDAPRFPWRGLMLDVSRHFLPVDAVKRNLRAMASMKMNVLHWHLADDQGFRVESKTFPKLHEMGSDGLFFTQNQITDIIRYADELGIRVIPEFDVPGHSTAWFVGYPEYASAPGPYKIERNWGIFDPTFNPAKEETYQFFDILFTEMCNLFPDAYFHIGGDENNGKQWNANSDIQDFMKKNAIRDNHELQAYFNKRL
ncbi:partial hexosaminidase, partial [uncultured bacterium]